MLVQANTKTTHSHNRTTMPGSTAVRGTLEMLAHTASCYLRWHRFLFADQKCASSLTTKTMGRSTRGTSHQRCFSRVETTARRNNHRMVAGAAWGLGAYNEQLSPTIEVVKVITGVGWALAILTIYLLPTVLGWAHGMQFRYCS